MDILFKKILAQLLFWIYDFIDTLGAIFNILTGTQTTDGSRTLLQVFIDSAVSTKVLIGLCVISVVIAGACVGVKTAKNIIQIKSGGEQPSHATTIKQGFFAILSSVICIFFVVLFIAFASMLLNMVNDVITPSENMTLSQNLFSLSVEQSYVIDESRWEEREIGDYYDDSGNRVQAQDPKDPSGLAWEKDALGNYILNDEGKPIEVWVQQVERYHPYLYVDGEIVIQTGWIDGYSAQDISWSMTPDQVFGVHNKDFIGLFEQADQGYKSAPMVRLEAFNLFTAYLVAIILLISMFMLSVGLVKRIYDIIVLFICMPLVCGTIPLDDGARFRAWREAFMSKVLVAFGAVISLNVFFMITGFIMSAGFDLSYLINEGILDATAVSVFKMLLLLGGALCLNGSQALIARILGTSADESREAMQSFSLITSGVRMGAAGALGAGRFAMGAKRLAVGGTNRYGRQRVGAIPYMLRGINTIGEKVDAKNGNDNYSASRGAAFVRKLGRMGGRNSDYAHARAGAGLGAGTNASDRQIGIMQPTTINGRAADYSPARSDENIRASLPRAVGIKPGAFRSNGGSVPGYTQQNTALTNNRNSGTQPYGIEKPTVGDHKNNSAPFSNGYNPLAPDRVLQPTSVNNNITNTVTPASKPESSIKPTNGELRTKNNDRKSSAFNNRGSRKRK